ncbi:MAG: hypothetical protein EOO48_00990 [Flavobacterium sp.]|nr:MAG: hypothetical protein EOO48_00990 [Flavobacterium sp.]
MNKVYFLLLISLAFLSCQDEDNSVKQQLGSALNASAPLSKLILRLSQNPTHFDNVLDGSDCYSIMLPVTINVNGQTISVEDEDDFDIIENLINASGNDDDIIHFVFPIVIAFADFDEMSINSQSQLDAIDCIGDDGFHEIRCADFAFPIIIHNYNIGDQVASNVSIINDRAFHDFLGGLSNTEIYTIVYPVTVIVSGQAVTVNDNDQLEDAIEASINDCDNLNDYGRTRLYFLRNMEFVPGRQPSENRIELY